MPLLLLRSPVCRTVSWSISRVGILQLGQREVRVQKLLGRPICVSATLTEYKYSTRDGLVDKVATIHCVFKNGRVSRISFSYTETT
jgi:hypothetical protein